jgi:hypothetical protein
MRLPLGAVAQRFGGTDKGPVLLAAARGSVDSSRYEVAEVMGLFHVKHLPCVLIPPTILVTGWHAKAHDSADGAPSPTMTGQGLAVLAFAGLPFR